MILTVLEPSYCPNLETCSRLSSADTIVWADTFGFKKQGSMNRMAVKTDQGEKWLTVPAHSGHSERQLIKETTIDITQPWAEKHLSTLVSSYRKTPFYEYYIEPWTRILEKEWTHLEPLIFNTSLFILEKLHITSTIVKAHWLPQVKNRSLRVCSWLKETHCDTYLVDKREILLIDRQMIENAGYKVKTFQAHNEPYFQPFGNFIENLSALDLLFNEGIEGKSYLLGETQLQK